MCTITHWDTDIANNTIYAVLLRECKFRENISEKAEDLDGVELHELVVVSLLLAEPSTMSHFRGSRSLNGEINTGKLDGRREPTELVTTYKSESLPLAATTAMVTGHNNNDDDEGGGKEVEDDDQSPSRFWRDSLAV